RVRIGPLAGLGRGGGAEGARRRPTSRPDQANRAAGLTRRETRAPGGDQRRRRPVTAGKRSPGERLGTSCDSSDEGLFRPSVERPGEPNLVVSTGSAGKQC